MEFDVATIYQSFNQLIWPLFRVAAMLMAMVIFGTRMVPARVRIVLSIAITLMIAPNLPAMPDLDVFSGAGFITLIIQLGIGLSMGLATRIMFETFVFGGHMIAMQTGLGFSSLVDPASGVQVPVLSQFFLLMATLIFLAVDGHLLMLKILVESFYSFPVGVDLPVVESFWSLIMFAKWLFAGGVLMAISASLSLLIVNITFGVLTKASPQLNIFTIGFPITLIAGLAIIWLTMSGFFTHFQQQYLRTTDVVCVLAKVDC